MLAPLTLSSVLLVSQVPITNDYRDYNKYKDYVDSEIINPKLPNNKPTLEYNTLDSQEYLESLIEKSFYSPIIKELENDAR
ncbi:hypothetical protein EB001_18535 [bacterium]|jgi:hypothetical protein|nr:hypothetical protein [bacterium]